MNYFQALIYIVVECQVRILQSLIKSMVIMLEVPLSTVRHFQCLLILKIEAQESHADLCETQGHVKMSKSFSKPFSSLPVGTQGSTFVLASWPLTIQI